MAMILFLGRALREVRDGAGLSLRDIDHASRAGGAKGFTESKLSRLERGVHERWPADIDTVIRTYAQVCDSTELTIWHRALTLQDEAARAKGAVRGERATRRARREGRRAGD